jgi:hypothetical protein
MLDFAARLEAGADYESRLFQILKGKGWTIFAPARARLLPTGEAHAKIESPKGSFIAPDCMAWPHGGGLPLLLEVRMKRGPWDGAYPLNAAAKGRSDRWLPLQGAQRTCGGVCVVIADQQAKKWRIAPVTRLGAHIFRRGDFWMLPVFCFESISVLFNQTTRERFIAEAYKDEWDF